MNENETSSRMVEKGEAKLIEIGGRVGTGPIAFVTDGDYIVSGDGKHIRRWRVKDGKEVGQPMGAETSVQSIAISRDGKWIVNGTRWGEVTVWDAESHKKAIKFSGHNGMVSAVDISPDGTRFATGSWDKTVCVWSLSTGKQLLSPFKRGWYVGAVKFSPDGRRIATATSFRGSVRIYDSHNGRQLVDTPIRVGSLHNQSLAWGGLGKELLALSKDGDIHCIDVVTGTTLSKWAIHANNPRCIALASGGAFIAASDSHSVSFWDIATRKQIGPHIHHPNDVSYMAISANHNLAIGGDKKIILRKLSDVLPFSYTDHVCVFSATPDAKGTLITINRSQQQPAALRTNAEECRPEEMVGSHRTKDRCSSEPNQHEVPVQPLAIKELPPPKTDEKERSADINNIQSNFPRDLTGHVIKSGGFPIASGSYGDIYKGTLNVRGGSIEVRRCLFS